MFWVAFASLLLSSLQVFCQAEDGFNEYDSDDLPYTIPQILESTTGIPATAVLAETNTLYPPIGAERRQIMNWGDGLLIKRYVDSGRNRTKFLNLLRKEFNFAMYQKRLKQLDIDSRRLPKPKHKETVNRTKTIIKGRFQNWRPPEISESVITHLINIHNNIRSNVNPSADEMWKLSWDYTLEASAFQKVATCKFTGRRSYSKFRSPGENLWIGWGVNEIGFNPEQAITTWLKEKKYFDPRLQLCLGGPCEYYVQLIWYPTYKVGCAWTQCDKVSVYGVVFTNPVYFACHYGPRGIKLPFLAYYKGPSCSFCPPEDKCERRLCSNANREITWGSKPWVKGPSGTPEEDVDAVYNPQLIKALLIFLLLIAITCVVTALILIVAKLLRLNKKYGWVSCPACNGDKCYYGLMNCFYRRHHPSLSDISPQEIYPCAKTRFQVGPTMTISERSFEMGEPGD